METFKCSGGFLDDGDEHDDLSSVLLELLQMVQLAKFSRKWGISRHLGEMVGHKRRGN